MRFPTTGTTLIARLNGNDAAWEDFFGRYRTVIADLGGFRGLSPDECEELVQNVMIRFYEKIEAGFNFNKNP